MGEEGSRDEGRELMIKRMEGLGEVTTYLFSFYYYVRYDKGHIN